jgi:hypothetical protein
MIGKKLRAALWNHPGLVLHVLPATGKQTQRSQSGKRRGSSAPPAAKCRKSEAPS